MTAPTVAWSLHTDVGRTRERNEDAAGGELGVDVASGEARGVFVVCDGMGGHAGGREASTLAVEVLRRRLGWVLREPWPEAAELGGRVEEALRAAHAAIAERNDAVDAGGRDRAGTTAVVLLLSGARACVAHVGDSRAYLVTGAETVQLTADHNVATRETNRGERPEDAQARPDARQLTQALGPIREEQLRPTLVALTVQQDSLFLLCTDGLSDGGFVEAHEAELLRPLLAGGAGLEAGCRALVARAAAVNGHDNVTALLVRVAGLGAGAREPTTEPRADAVTRQATAPARAGWLGRLGFGRRS
jgi:protein phosphatase